MSTGTGYVLGHHDPEVERLLLQGRLYRGHTEHALRQAGLEPGMRVLDVGCGPGDVSIAAAHLVGPAGSVTGVDAQASILDLAALRAAEAGLSNVTFRHAAVEELDAPRPFDAVIGRLILMHLPDPVASLRRLVGLVRPGGLVSFQDFEVSGARSAPAVPLFERVRDVIVQAFRGAGATTETGTALPGIFHAAGLPMPALTMGACLGPLSDPDIMGFVMGVWRALSPVAVQLGLDVGDLADLDRLPARLVAEAAEAGAIAILPPLVSAWARVPAA